MRLLGDYHTHSQYSHGRGNIRENIKAARRRGLKEIAITDHGPRTHSIIRLGVKSADQLLKIKNEIDRLKEEFSEMTIFAGVEANIINIHGELDVPEEILAGLDLVAAGLHLLIIPPDLKNGWRLIGANKIIYPLFPDRREEIRQQNTEMVINAVRHNKIDFITHPGYQVDIDTYSLARVCAEEGTCLEINTRHGELTRGFVEAAARTAVRFVINSDAHNPSAVGKLEAGLKIIEELGLEEGRIINFTGFNNYRQGR